MAEQRLDGLRAEALQLRTEDDADSNRRPDVRRQLDRTVSAVVHPCIFDDELAARPQSAATEVGAPVSGGAAQPTRRVDVAHHRQVAPASPCTGADRQRVARTEGAHRPRGAPLSGVMHIELTTAQTHGDRPGGAAERQPAERDLDGGAVQRSAEHCVGRGMSESVHRARRRDTEAH